MHVTLMKYQKFLNSKSVFWIALHIFISLSMGCQAVDDNVNGRIINTDNADTESAADTGNNTGTVTTDTESAADTGNNTGTVTTDTESAADTGTDTGTATTDTESAADTGTDTGTVTIDTESAVDTGTATDTESSTVDTGTDIDDLLVPQNPLKIKVRNASDRTLYIYDQAMESQSLVVSYASGAAIQWAEEHSTPVWAERPPVEWGSCEVFARAGWERCDTGYEPSPSSIDCGPLVVWEFLSGDEFSIEWSAGTYIIESCPPDEPGGVPCYYEFDNIFPGTLKARVCVSTDFEYSSSGCEDFHLRSPAGVSKCFETNFEVPTTDTEVEIVITDF